LRQSALIFLIWKCIGLVQCDNGMQNSMNQEE